MTLCARPYQLYIIYASLERNIKHRPWLEIQISPLFWEMKSFSVAASESRWKSQQAHMVRWESLTDRATLWRTRWLGNGLCVSSHTEQSRQLFWLPWLLRFKRPLFSKKKKIKQNHVFAAGPFNIILHITNLICFSQCSAWPQSPSLEMDA